MCVVKISGPLACSLCACRETAKVRRGQETDDRKTMILECKVMTDQSASPPPTLLQPQACPRLLWKGGGSRWKQTGVRGTAIMSHDIFCPFPLSIFTMPPPHIYYALNPSLRGKVPAKPQENGVSAGGVAIVNQCATVNLLRIVNLVGISAPKKNI